MSDAATFWAAKSTNVKSSQTFAQVPETTFPRATPKRNGMSLKGKSSPLCPTANADSLSGIINGVKKSNWADSDDEEEFMASFHLSERVRELEKTVFDKDARITKLESALEDQKQCQSALQNAVDASCDQIEELQQENHKHFSHVQKLIAEVDEKGRRITDLETEFNLQCARIAELNAEDCSTQASSHSAITRTESATSPAKIEADYEMAETNRNDLIERTAEKAAIKDTESSISTFAQTKSNTAAGPAPVLSAFPIFATPAMTKHMAPPPPAPKLKMPIDLSKFLKKPAAKVDVSKKKVETASHEVAKDGPAPTINPTSDIRTKHHEERALFANGPKVQVRLGDKLLATLPKYVLMQTSQLAFKYFTASTGATAFVLPARSMDETAAKVHLDWMKEMTYQGRVYSVTLHSDEKFDDKNLQICRAARVLGLNNMYVGHFTKIFCDRIRTNATSFELLNKIATLSYPENDPLYDCLVNNLANLRAHNAMKNPTEIEALLKKHTGLKARVEKAEESIRKKHDGAKGLKGTKAVHVGKKM